MKKHSTQRFQQHLGNRAISLVIVIAFFAIVLATPACSCTPSDLAASLPVCESADQLRAPDLREPVNGAIVSGVFTEVGGIDVVPVRFWWSYTVEAAFAFCYGDWYRIDISETADFADISWGFTVPHNPEEQQTRDWQLPEGCYYWRASAYSSVAGGSGPFSTPRHFCVEGANPPTERSLPVPTLTPTPPPPPRPIPSPEATAKKNLNCRAGPGPLYEIEDTFFEGESAPIEGRNEESTWWLIRSPNLEKSCWVWGQEIETSGDPSQAQVVEVAPLPEPTEETEPADEPEPEPVSCSQYMDSKTCDADASCWWDWKDPQYPSGVCKNK